MKTVFTTGEVAKICKISQQTVIRCFDSGLLKGFRIPGSKFRKILREDLISFMKSSDIPLAFLGDDKVKVIVMTCDPKLEDDLRENMTSERFDVVFTENTFATGATAAASPPDAIVIDCSSGTKEAAEIAERLRAYSVFEQTMLVALIQKQLRRQSVPGVEIFEKPFDPSLLAERLCAIAREKRGE